MTDADLLRRFVEENREDAFRELVRRRIDLVYAAALRQLGGDAHRAQDITQQVFIDFARKACRAGACPPLAWLAAVPSRNRREIRDGTPTDATGSPQASGGPTRSRCLDRYIQSLSPAAPKANAPPRA